MNWKFLPKKKTTAGKTKKSKGREWLDAFVFAIVAATIIRGLLFSAYAIPSGSMEGTELTGGTIPARTLYWHFPNYTNQGSKPAGAVRDGQVAVRNLHLGMRLAAQLAHRLENLGEAAAIGRVVVAQAAAVGVEGQLAGARDQISVGDQATAFAFLAEAEILELHQDRDGEAVVDRGIFDILGRHAGHRKGRWP